MKKIGLFLFFILGLIPIYADVTEKKVVAVDFPKFGTYQSETEIFYRGIDKREDTDVTVQGRGFFGNILAGIFPKGKNITILDLNEKMQYNAKVVEKTFTKQKIQKIFEDDNEEYYDDAEESEEDYEEEGESSYKMLRKEFKVEKIGKEELNQFNTTKYRITYILEKQNIETMDRSIDSLNVVINSTENEKIFSKLGAEKTKHQKAMMDAVGLEMEETFYQQMLGMNWLNMVQAMGDEEQPAELDIDYAELKKIKGTPVLVDGAFFVKTLKAEEDEEESPKLDLGNFSGFGAALGKKALKKATKKKKKNAFKKMVAYRIETREISFDSLSKSHFRVPGDFKEIIVPGQE